MQLICYNPKTEEVFFTIRGDAAMPLPMVGDIICTPTSRDYRVVQRAFIWEAADKEPIVQIVLPNGNAGASGISRNTDLTVSCACLPIEEEDS